MSGVPDNGRRPEWLLDVGVARNDVYYQSAGTSLIVTAKAALLNAKYAEAEAIVDTMRGLYGPNNHVFGSYTQVSSMQWPHAPYGSDRLFRSSGRLG